MTNEEKLMTCDECGCHTSEGVSVTRVKTGLGQTVTRCSNHHTPETKYGAEEVARLPSYYDESEGAAVSASPQPRCPKCQSEDLRLIVNSNSLVMDMFCLHGHDFLNIHWPAGFAQFFAAAPAQEPRQDLYVISSTGDGAQTIIVLESKLKQSVHDTYCACGLEWPKCADEVITETLAKVDDEEEWTREYPAYRRHVWSDHGEDYTVTIMRVTAAQEQPVEPVAEPASTGEPECGQFTGRYSHCKKPRGHDGSCNPLHGIVFVAARPSEPSANFMQKIGGTCLKHGEYNGQQCPKWPDCISAAAPQPVSGMYISETKPRKVDDARITEIFNREPVSGDAPKVEDAKK